MQIPEHTALSGKGIARDAGVPDFRSFASLTPYQAGRSPWAIPPPATSPSAAKAPAPTRARVTFYDCTT
jgi:hypothetical protein